MAVPKPYLTLPGNARSVFDGRKVALQPKLAPVRSLRPRIATLLLFCGNQLAFTLFAGCGLSSFLSKLALGVSGFPLMTNACHKNQIAGFVKFVARQIAAAPTRNNEFSQSTLNWPPDAGLMRQNLQSVQDEVQQLTRHRII